MQQMLSISESSNPGDCISQSMKSALLCSLLSFLLDVYHIHDQTQAEEIPNDHMVNRAMQYINLNYDKELTLDSIARYLYVNPSYLSTVFKRETGDALMVYINKRRIRQARYYLTNTQLRITRIAELVGFHSASYFNVVFKSIEGCTPQVYRHDHEDIPEN